jgi:formamidopyrimidine-DNA glycosylase
VQTIINDLNEKIAGDTITGFWTDWPKTIKGLKLEEFEKQIKNKKIKKAWRIGKNMFIDLSGNKTLYIHLKMTGHLLVKTRNEKLETKNYFSDKVNQYIHHVWQLGKSKTLEFSDLRKFGKIMLVDTDKIVELKEIKELGMDVLDSKFTLEKFQEMINKKSNTPIGILLMDQNILSGIGNIYRSEILFEAGVSPFCKTKDVSLDERNKIYKAIKKVLEKAIKLRGTSDSDYRDTAGAPGGFQKVLKVYNRESTGCKKCREEIKRKKLGGRSVFFCEKCQS